MNRLYVISSRLTISPKEHTFKLPRRISKDLWKNGERPLKLLSMYFNILFSFASSTLFDLLLRKRCSPKLRGKEWGNKQTVSSDLFAW